jgi:hypothetical protein
VRCGGAVRAIGRAPARLQEGRGHSRLFGMARMASPANAAPTGLS